MAIDKLNFSGINSGSENNLISKKTIGDRLMEYGANLNEQENAREKLRLLEEDRAYQRGRDALSDARQDKKDKRLDLETAAQDLYKNELFKGQQTKGGSYGDALATDSNKYDLTPIEQTNMQKYFANGMYDTNAMRKSGDNILADKIDWQNKASSNVGSFIESGVGKESRSEMYDRIGSVLASKGLLIPESLVTSADQARLAEAKSEEDKLKDIETQRSDILKRSREDNWKQVNAKTNSNGETVYDADGNELQVGRRTANSLQKEFKTGVDNTGDSIKIIQESINKLDKIEPEKKADAISQVNSVINAVAARGIPIDEAARMVSGELTQKGDKSWFFEKFDPAINQKAIDSYADQFVKNMPKKQNATYSSNNDGASKFDLASELVAQNRAADAESLAKLNSDKAKLLAGEETRRANRIDEWLKSQGLKSSEPVKNSNIDSVETKTPGSESNSKTDGNTLADRNFNPGNIRITKDNWIGGTEGEKGFVKFQTPELGARGLAKTIINGGVGSTIEQYISKYAPESDNNDTNGYIKMVSKSLGKDPSEKISKEDVPALMKVIARKEGGKFSDKVLDDGYKLAIGEKSVEDHIKDSAGKIRLQSTQYGKQEDFTDANAFNKYFENNGGIFDRNKNIHDIMVDKKIGRPSAEKYYDEVVKPEVDALKKSLKKENYVGERVYSNEEEYRNSDEYKQLNSPQSSGSKPIDYINAGLGTANSIAANAINTVAAPYNTLKYGTDSLMNRLGFQTSNEKTIFDRNAEKARETAIDRLSKVTDYPEEVLFGAELVAPVASGKVRAVSSSEINNLRNIVAPTKSPSFKIDSDEIVDNSRESIINKFGLTANKKAKVNSDTELKDSINNRLNINLQIKDIKDKNTANALWNGIADAYAKGQIPKEKVFEKMQELNESRFIGTRDLMLAIDNAFIKTSQELGNKVNSLKSELFELNKRKPGRPSAEYREKINKLADEVEKAIAEKEKYDFANKINQ